LALTRQGLPAVRDYEERNLCANGAYELASGGKDPQVTIMASGSEVEIALQAREQLKQEGVEARVVSVPCMELFDQQTDSVKADVLGDTPVRIAVEAAIQMSWDRYLRPQDRFIGMEAFGASAPAAQLFEHFGITAEAIVETARKALA
jgi:transketolase